MKDVVGATMSEQKLIVAIQKKLGIVANGYIGAQTMSAIAEAIGADCWPLTLQIYSQPVIIAKDIIACNPNATLAGYRNTISGSFSYQSKPCSVLISGGKTIYGGACHAWLGKPESVLYRLQDGTFGVKRCLSASELPQGVRWAVGGLGLLGSYNPTAEGFTGAYSDVLRRTNHTVLGVKDGYCYLVYVKNKTGAEVNAFCRDKLMLDYAVMLDGGHVAAINGDESFAKINTTQKQFYMIQGVGA